MRKVFPLITVIVLCVAMILPCFVTTVSAESDLVPATYVDILQAAHYYSNINGGSFSEIARPYRYLSGVQSSTFRWNAARDDIKFHDYYFTIQATGVPAAVIVSLNSSHSVTAEYVGSNDDLHQYHFYSANHNIGDIKVTASWDYSYFGNYAVLTFIGLRDYSQSVTNANYRFRISRYSDGGVHYSTLSYGSAAALPVGGYHSGYYPNGELFTGDLLVWLPQKVLDFAYADSVSFLISTFTPIMSYSVSLVDTSTTVKAVVPSDILYSCSASLRAGNIDKQMFFYQVNADLRGYDLSDVMIQLYVEADTTYGPSSTEYQEVTLNCVAASLVPPSAEVPWYVTMYGWLNSSIYSNLDKVTQAILSLGGSMNDPVSDSIANEVISDANGYADQAGSINDKMNSVSRPSAGSVGSAAGSVDVSNIIGTSSAPLVMSMLTGDSSGLIPTILLMVFTFALVGFVFFGKR